MSATGVTIPSFDHIIKLIRLQGGNKLDGIYLSYGLQAVVNQIISPAARYFVNLDQSKQNLTMQAGDKLILSPLNFAISVKPKY